MLLLLLLQNVLLLLDTTSASLRYWLLLLHKRLYKGRLMQLHMTTATGVITFNSKTSRYTTTTSMGNLC